MFVAELTDQRRQALLTEASARRLDGRGHGRRRQPSASTSARIRSRVVRMPFRFVRPLAQPNAAQ